MRLASGSHEGQWSYVKKPPAHQGELTLTFSQLPTVSAPIGIHLTCVIALLFEDQHSGRLSADCRGGSARQFPGGMGSFQIQSFF